MQRYARVVDGVVFETIETAGAIADMFHPSQSWHPCPPEVEQNWLFADGVFAPPPPPPPTPEMVDAIRDRRLAEGFADPVTGKVIQTRPGTDDVARMTAIGAAAGLALALGTTPAPTFEIIAADNSVLELGPADAFALLQGRCMPWYSATILYANALKAQIRAGTPPADLEAGWPEP